MNISQITGIYFSPTGTTKSVTEWITGQIAADKQKTDEVDLTDAILSRPDYTFTEHELAVVGVPVYGGRVPETATERLKKCMESGPRWCLWLRLATGHMRMHCWSFLIS